MSDIMKNLALDYKQYKQRLSKGFTLIELLVTISILSIVMAIALPNLGQFLAKMNVDNEISEMNRLLLIARNNAINSGRVTTVCPLNASNNCTNDWSLDISVFDDGDGDIDTYTAANDQLIKVKTANSNASGTLTFGYDSVVYGPDGTLANTTNIGTMKYCPDGYNDEGRAIFISISGRAYASQEAADGKEKDRSGAAVTCP